MARVRGITARHPDATRLLNEAAAAYASRLATAGDAPSNRARHYRTRHFLNLSVGSARGLGRALRGAIGRIHSGRGKKRPRLVPLPPAVSSPAPPPVAARRRRSAAAPRPPPLPVRLATVIPAPIPGLPFATVGSASPAAAAPPPASPAPAGAAAPADPASAAGGAPPPLAPPAAPPPAAPVAAAVATAAARPPVVVSTSAAGKSGAKPGAIGPLPLDLVSPTPAVAAHVAAAPAAAADARPPARHASPPVAAASGAPVAGDEPDPEFDPQDLEDFAEAAAAVAGVAALSRPHAAPALPPGLPPDDPAPPTAARRVSAATRDRGRSAPGSALARSGSPRGPARPGRIAKHTLRPAQRDAAPPAPPRPLSVVTASAPQHVSTSALGASVPGPPAAASVERR